MSTIYVADDENNIREALQKFLVSEGYSVSTFENGDMLLDAFRNKPCDLVILDVMMPGSNGFTVCTELRKLSTVPIIMLTARDSDLDYATGLSLGSDDYFTKPFSAIALVMRVRAIFRRIEYEKHNIYTPGKDELTFGDVRLSLNAKQAYIGNTLLDLTPNEYSLLLYLLENSGNAVSRDELLNKVWGYSSDIETRVADDAVRSVRKKLTDSTVMIETVWGFGFTLKLRDEPDSPDNNDNA